MLPAPHNIEFFVRTSETKTLLEEVLQHVEVSKEMIKALGEWMANLSVHEQIFLIWVEIQSTSSILFANDSASKINLKAAFRETLAFLYKKEKIYSIPPSSFSVAKDKFEMILLESKDEDSELEKFDFVHPSYHEALWYAIKNKPRFSFWWKILNDNLTEMLNDEENKLDHIQMRMIEHYGIVNRDLDKWVLIFAESKEPEDRCVAFQHMLEKIEVFADSPSLYSCMDATISSRNTKYKIAYVNFLSKNFKLLSPKIIDKSMLLLVDRDSDIQRKYLKICLDKKNVLNNITHKPEIKVWPVMKKIRLIELLNKYLNQVKVDQEVFDSFLDINLYEFKAIFQNNLALGDKLIQFTFENRRYKIVSDKQKTNIKSIKNYIRSRRGHCSF